MSTIEGVAPTEWIIPGSDSPEAQAVYQQASVQNATPGGELGKDEFLTLLVTQLSSQDPLEPMSSTESIAQLAQFSSLEQMQNINDQIEAQRHSSGLMDAMLIQGMNVEATLSDGTTVQGVVEKMSWQDGEMILMINGTNYTSSLLTGMRLLETSVPPVEEPLVQTPVIAPTEPEIQLTPQDEATVPAVEAIQ